MHNTYRTIINDIQKEIEKVIYGQKTMVQSIICTLLARGHILLEGIPGLAKSLAVSTFASTIGGEFRRIQFTPDKLPSDITGVTVYNESTAKFEFYKGPIFCNLLLADEINRASPKVQSALLEAMQEKMVTIERKDYNLPDLFMVLASQNPIEQVGTYPLSEAQLDRFMSKVEIYYPSIEDEAQLIRKKSLDYEEIRKSVKEIVSPSDIVDIQDHIAGTVKISEGVLFYIQQLCIQTRKVEETVVQAIKRYVSVGVSPRGAEHLIYFCKSFAYLHGRDYVSFGDVDICAPYVLGHRIVLNESARMDGIRGKDIIKEVVQSTLPYQLQK